MTTWYAILRDKTDNDLSVGSFDKITALRMAEEQECTLIAHCVDGDNVVEIEEVEQW